MHQYTTDITTTRLTNGALVLSETLPGVESVTVGVWTDAGSAEETTHAEFGLAHFLEHMFFKGTATRSAFQMADMIETVGGELNAYTERDSTHIYARTLSEHLPLALELIADMVCHSSFPPEELERERQVITEEILKYEAMPEESIQDTFMASLWQGGALGHAILGDTASVRGITREMLIDCQRQHFTAARVIITAAGKVDHAALVALAEQHFADLPTCAVASPEYELGAQDKLTVDEDENEQINFLWGGRSWPVSDERNFALAIIDTVLGGSATSRLFQEIREKRGLAYDISSYTGGFRDTGFLAVSGACSADNFPLVIRLVRAELEKMRMHRLTAAEFTRAKEQIKVGLALSLETTAEHMRRMAQHMLTWGYVRPLQEIITRIAAVTEAEVRSVLDELLNLDSWTFAATGPVTQEQVQQLLEERE